VLVELTDEEALVRLLDASRPDAVVHAAAIGRSSQCEERPDEAERVNARLPGTMARDLVAQVRANAQDKSLLMVSRSE